MPTNKFFKFKKNIFDLHSQYPYIGNYVHIRNGTLTNKFRSLLMASGGSGMGWIVWIGGLLLFNGLSYFFEWGWTIY
ncbi:MAG: hypothetical protein COA78_19640 [Blastopirellula sp.]|nr:MAG: hypothetical protein COA78_19640 [Blastopirellula sp.]